MMGADDQPGPVPAPQKRSGDAEPGASPPGAVKFHIPEPSAKLSTISGQSPVPGAAWKAGEDAPARPGSVCQKTVIGRVSIQITPMTPTKEPSKRKVPRKNMLSIGIIACRKALARSRWYRSRPAEFLRSKFQSKVFGIVMMIVLFCALFFPYMCIILSVSSNTGPDVVLTIVMVAFVVELIGLSITDANYLFSFFFFMDVIGTISMIFDISYFELFDEVDATRPSAAGVASSGPAVGTENTMFLRAARAAKIGARAGRLSRVLRILHFLPCLAKVHEVEAEPGNERNIASVISAQLSNLVATRVACLTILLMMTIPLFEVLTQRNDLALTAWTQKIDRVHTRLADSRTSNDAVGIGFNEDAILRYLGSMVSFFDDPDKRSASVTGYGPYMACAGRRADPPEVFRCNRTVVGWSPSFVAPSRLSSAKFVSSEHFMVAFNMHNPVLLQAFLQMGSIVFVLVTMVLSSLALSSVVTERAVRPLERMLGTVRQIATTVFKFSAEFAGEKDEAELVEEVDVENASEMKLLEKVVNKLAIVAELTSKKNTPSTEGLQTEDVGILNMMRGQDVVAEEAQEKTRKSRMVPKRQAIQTPMKVDDYGIASAVYDSWGFNPLLLTKEQNLALSIFTVARFHDEHSGYIRGPQDETVLTRFVTSVQREYLNNPFHNFGHALDVLHATSRIMRVIDSENWLSELEQFALLIAAIAHDIGHPGVNNGFLSEVGHELALLYNDRSPLENMHCSKLYQIIAYEESNIFRGLTKDEYKEVRKSCIETVLHTDMMGHQGMVKELQILWQVNGEILTDGSIGVTSPDGDIFGTKENKTLTMNAILHSADVSNPAKQWEVTEAWAMVCLEEFFAQGDQEKVLNIPVQFLNNRDTLNKPNSQIGFIEFMIAPFFATLIRMWPPMYELGDHLGNNICTWGDLWAKEVNPSEEERAKVNGRTQRVKDNMLNAKWRDKPPSHETPR